MSKTKMPLLFASVLVALFLISAADACPTCKDALGGNNGGLVRGFGWSIIFMMSVPFLVLAGVGGYFYYEVRRARHGSNHLSGVLAKQHGGQG